MQRDRVGLDTTTDDFSQRLLTALYTAPISIQLQQKSEDKNDAAGAPVAATAAAAATVDSGKPADTDEKFIRVQLAYKFLQHELLGYFELRRLCENINKHVADLMFKMPTTALGG